MTIISDTLTGEVTLGLGTYLTVTSTGTISSPGVGVFASYSTIINSGSISSASYDGVKAVGSTITNSGSISGYIEGVYLNSGTLTNSGSIHGGRYGVTAVYTTVSNSGTISSSINGVVASYSTVSNSGTISSNNIGVYATSSTITNSGYIDGVSSGIIAVHSTVSNSATISSNGIGVFAYGSRITNSGSINGAGGTGVYGIGSSITNYGIIGGNGFAIDQKLQSTLNLLSGAVFDGEVKDDGTGLLTLGGTAAAVLDMGGSFSGFENISFGSTAWTLEGTVDELANGQTITGFTMADRLDISGLAAPSQGTVTLDPSSVLTIPQDGGGSLDMTFSGDAGFVFTLTSDGQGGTYITDNVPCFCAGTRIATAAGEVKVEDLAIGDLVETLHAGLQKIKWIGRRSYDGRFIAANKDILPICIKRDAIAEDVPARDLFVSPGHAICIEGGLIHAFRLVNGVSITQSSSVESVTYYHVETASHEVIFAENCPAETFRDETFRAQFQNAPEYRALYPAQIAANSACLQQLEDGFLLDAIQKRLNAHAGILLPSKKLGALRGYVDEPGPMICSGWAQDLENPETPVCLDIMVGATRVARVLANRYRADLRQAGLGSGCHAFRAALPSGLTGRLQIRRAADSAELSWTEAALAQAA